MEALLRELELRANELQGERIDTVYLGGGTPSLLTADQFQAIWEQVNRHFDLASDAEVTLEANPDDLKPETLAFLQRSPVNRLSIGIQSFVDAELRWMNRAHSAKEAIACIRDARAAGFDNFSIDLIYGLPGQSEAVWQRNLEQALELDPPHISAYALTVEPKTALAAFIRKGKQQAPDEQVMAQHFQQLTETLTEHGYRHYEISNFCQPGVESRHNSSYWSGSKYLGIGPSAHSFNGTHRSWNVANNAVYIREITAGNLPSELEELSLYDRYNEWVMTGLRMDQGLDLNQCKQLFGFELMRFLEREAQPHLAQGDLIYEENRLKLTTQGKLLADGIASDLFYLYSEI